MTASRWMVYTPCALADNRHQRLRANPGDKASLCWVVSPATRLHKSMDEERMHAACRGANAAQAPCIESDTCCWRRMEKEDGRRAMDEL